MSAPDRRKTRANGRGRYALGGGLAFGLAALTAFADVSSAQAQVACHEGTLFIRKHDTGETLRFMVAVVDTVQTRAQGLMFVPQMPDMAGMLFVYDAPESPSFWMRNTLIPLDMLFAAPDGEITRIHENAIPHDETAIPGGPNVQYVLEINGGAAEALGLTAGDHMIHPSIAGSCN